MTCGTTPKITSCSRLEPVARMPSTGRGSAASTASENSFAMMPVLWMNKRHHAGERPKADRDDEQQREHDFVDGAAGIHQAAHRLHDPGGQILDELRIENGMPSTTASAVPQTAIWMVTTISSR